LDAKGGGDMSKYFETTKKMINMKPWLIVPAHGMPVFKPLGLLHFYLKHRQERETHILNAVLSGADSLEKILEVVYSDVPKMMWVVARQNVILHLQKLSIENKLPSHFIIPKL